MQFLSTLVQNTAQSVNNYSKCRNFQVSVIFLENRYFSKGGTIFKNNILQVEYIIVTSLHSSKLAEKASRDLATEGGKLGLENRRRQT